MRNSHSVSTSPKSADGSLSPFKMSPHHSTGAMLLPAKNMAATSARRGPGIENAVSYVKIGRAPQPEHARVQFRKRRIGRDCRNFVRQLRPLCIRILDLNPTGSSPWCCALFGEHHIGLKTKRPCCLMSPLRAFPCRILWNPLKIGVP